MSNISVYGLFASTREIERTAERLQEAGFRTPDISILLPYNDGSKDLCSRNSTKAPEGASAGASTGAVLGGALGWLAGIGAFAVPGVGAFVAAGPVMSMLAGAGAIGVMGGVTGALIGIGFPEYEAKRYAGRVARGGMLMSIHCDNTDWQKRAQQILLDEGAEDIASTKEASADFDVTEKPHFRDVVLTK